MNSDLGEPVNFPFPGRRARKVRRLFLASLLIFLVTLGTFSHLLPSMMSENAAAEELEPEKSQKLGPGNFVYDGPKYSLPPGTVRYGAREPPSYRAVSDGAVPPKLLTSPEHLVYETYWGRYSFDRSSPFTFSLSSRSGTPLTNGSFFFISSSASLMPGTANVTASTDTKYAVRYSVLTGQMLVGALTLNVDFFADRRPKFTVSFEKSPDQPIGDFNIVWQTYTSLSWLRGPDGLPGLRIPTVAQNVEVPGVGSVELGPWEDHTTWKERLVVDWSDAPQGRLEVGHFSAAGYSGSGLKVTFPTNMDLVDPTQVATSAADWATAYSTQRKTFNYGGYYFLFWYDGANIVYSSSINGVGWSAPISTGSGLLNFGFDLYNLGTLVAIVWLKYVSGVAGDGVTDLKFRKGTIVGNSVSWDPIRNVAALPAPYSMTPSLAVGTDGVFWAGGVWYPTPTPTQYSIWIYRSNDGVTFSLSDSYLTSSSGSRLESLQLIPMSRGRLMALSSHWADETIRWKIWNPVSPQGSYWSSLSTLDIDLPTSVPKWDLISAVAAYDSFFQVDLVYILYKKYSVTFGSQIAWGNFDSQTNQFSAGQVLYTGEARYPTVSTDSFGNLYAFWMAESSGVPTYLMHTSRPRAGITGVGWSPVSQPFGSGSLITNAKWLSAVKSGTKQVHLAWTLTGASPYKVMSGSIPLPSGVASAPPSEPWNRVGLSPFAQAGEYVSPGNGLLAVAHTDISVPGRNGLDLAISRVYVQPFTVLQGNAFNYDKSPYASVGDGWRLNLPWVGKQHIHYLNGEIFPIVWTSVTKTVPPGYVGNTTKVMENHQGADFIFAETVLEDPQGPFPATYKLLTKDGTRFDFDSSGLVESVTDRTGSNKLLFYYGFSGLETITDTVGRNATFSYNPSNVLTSVTYGGQTVTYGYSGTNLVSATNQLGHTLTFRYSPLNSWLLSGVIYPTGGNSTYTYGSVQIGTEAVNYYVTLQNVFAGSLVRSTSFSYEMTDGLVTYTEIAQSNGVSVQGYTTYESHPRSSSTTVTVLDSNRLQMRKSQVWYDLNGRVVQEDVYNGNSSSRSYSTSRSYDNWGNIVYTRDPLGRESYQSYANTDKQYTFYGPGRLATTAEGRVFFDDFNLPSLGIANVSGVSSSSVVDIYAGSNDGGANIHDFPSGPGFNEAGQCFTPSTTGTITKAQFTMTKSGNPTANLVVKLYATTGTYGTDCVPSGAALATSNTVSATTLSGTSTTVDFTFAAGPTISAGTRYAIGVQGVSGTGTLDVNNFVSIRRDATSPSHHGNGFSRQGTTYQSNNLADSLFSVTAIALVPTCQGVGPWTQGGSASGRTTSTRFSLLNLTGPSSTQGTWQSNWVRLCGTYGYPFYGEVQMALSANPGQTTLDADFQLSPQATSSNADPYLNSDQLRFILNDGLNTGPAYVIVKCVSGACSSIYNSVASGGSLSVSWKIILTDANTLTVYLNKGSGYELIFSTTTLGLSSSFAPSYAYLAMYNLNTLSYSATFDYLGLSSSNSISINGLQSGQKVELYDWNNMVQASGTVASGQSSITLTATNVIFPYGYLVIYELDARTVQFVSPTRELWGGNVYSYSQPFRSGGLTRTSTGFLSASNVYIDDSLPPTVNVNPGGGEAWSWASLAYAPVASQSLSHIGFSASGNHQHYFQEGYPSMSATSGYFHIQYVYIPSTSVPREVMLQFHDNAVANPGFDTGNFNAWTQNGMIIRGDLWHSPGYGAAPSYNPGTGIYSAFTLEQIFPIPVSGTRITAVKLWYRYGTSSDSAYVLYTDGSSTPTSLPFVLDWTEKTLSYDTTKQISGIRVVRSTGRTDNIVLDDFRVHAGGSAVSSVDWEHRAYWGENLIAWGADGTASRRNMGLLPTARDSWLMFIVKTDDVGTNGLNIDGIAYTLYDGGVYWDYSAIGGPSTGTLTVNGLVAGQKVELYDSGGSLKVSGTVPTGGSSVTLDVYNSGINVFPFKGYLKVYSASGSLQYQSHLMTDIWGGDVYTYRQPVFTNSFDQGQIPSWAHDSPIGSAQYQNAGSVLQESYSRYDSVGNLLQSRQLHNGSWLNSTFTYDAYGNMRTAVNPKGQTTTYSYSSASGFAYPIDVTRILNPGVNVTTSHVFDPVSGREVAIIDPMGNRTDYQYDAIGRTTRITYPAIGGITSYVEMIFQDSQNRVDVRNEKGNHTLYIYDGLGRRTTIERYSGDLSSPVLSRESYIYDWQGQVKFYTAPDGNVTSYVYDYLGRVIRVTNPDTTYRTVSYNDAEIVQSQVDENLNRVDYTYDLVGRLTSVREYYSPSGFNATSYSYDDVGNLVKSVTAIRQVLVFSPTDDAYIQSGSSANTNFGSATNLSIDASPTQHMLLKFSLTGVGSALVTSAKLRLYNIDSSTNGGDFYTTVTSSWSESSVTWNNAPASNPGLIASLGAVSANTWYEVNLTSIVSGDGTVSLRVSSPSTNAAQYSSKEGNAWLKPQLLVTLSTNQTTNYTYDDLDRVILTKYPDGFNQTTTYDEVGNVLSRRDPNGNTITYSYDQLNRLTTMTDPGGSTATYGYDKNDNRISAVNSDASGTFAYDARNRLVRETWTISGSSYTVSYAYDAVGNLAGITYPNLVAVTYSIDSLNRVSSVKSGATTLATLSYAANGRLSSISYGNGIMTTYAYDRVGRSTEIKVARGGTTLLDLDYGYDSVGNIRTIGTESYSYDALNRLTYASGPWGEIRYGLDQLGNRRWIKEGATNSTYVYGAYNRLLASGSISYTYDNNGNLKTQTSGSTTTSYTYDFENRLTQVAQGASTLGTYSYSPLGQRLKAVEGSTTTTYVALGPRTLYEKQVAGQQTTISVYAYARGLIIAKLSGSNIFYFHQDHLGNTRLVTKGTKTEFSTNYKPFGQQYGSSGTDPVYKYTAKPFSSATGLYYYGARWTDSAVGRFTTRDLHPGRLSHPQSLNPYIYTANNPMRYVDPLGLFECDVWNPGTWLGCSLNAQSYVNTQLTSVVSAGVNAWNNLDPTTQNAILLGFAIGITVVTGGAALPALLAVGAIGFAAGAGGYAAYTYATGGTPTLEGVLFWGTVGFSVATFVASIPSIGPKLLSALRLGGSAARTSESLISTAITKASHKGIPVPNPKIDIAGWRIYAHGRAVQRGMTEEMVKDIVQNGDALLQPDAYYFISKTGAVVVEMPSRIVITVYPAKEFYESTQAILVILGLI